MLYITFTLHIHRIIYCSNDTNQHKSFHLLVIKTIFSPSGIDLHDNNGSDPSYESPHLAKSVRGPNRSNAPEENRRLVVCYSNGMGKGRSPKSEHTLLFALLPQRGAGSHTSTTTEDVCLEERVPCHLGFLEGEETSV